MASDKFGFLSAPLTLAEKTLLIDCYYQSVSAMEQKELYNQLIQKTNEFISSKYGETCPTDVMKTWIKDEVFYPWLRELKEKYRGIGVFKDFDLEVFIDRNNVSFVPNDALRALVEGTLTEFNAKFNPEDFIDQYNSELIENQLESTNPAEYLNAFLREKILKLSEKHEYSGKLPLDLTDLITELYPLFKALPEPRIDMSFVEEALVKYKRDWESDTVITYPLTSNTSYSEEDLTFYKISFFDLTDEMKEYILGNIVSTVPMSQDGKFIRCALTRIDATRSGFVFVLGYFYK